MSAQPDLRTVAALVTVLVYAAALIGIGLWAARRARSADTFLIGDRSLGPWIAGLAYAATTSSAWVLLGFSGFVYATGPSALWMVPGILLGYLAVWLGVGPMLQRAAQRGCVSLTDILAEGADASTAHAIRLIASLLIGICFAFYIGAQLQGGGEAIKGVFGLDMGLAILIGTLIILAYVFLGGFIAVSWVDTFQGLIIALVAIVLPTAAFFAAGGLEGLSRALSEAPPVYRQPFGTATGMMALGLVVGLFATGFGALGQPHLLTWIMATRDTSARVRGAGVATVWGLFVYAGMAVLGLSARAIFGADTPAEGVFFRLAKDLLPPVLAGLTTAATLSAIMSTVDSQLLVAGGALARDIRRTRSSEPSASRVRWTIALLTLAALAITFLLPQSIFSRTLFAWTALGAAFGPVIVLKALRLPLSAPMIAASMLASFAVSLGFEFIWPTGPGQVWARTLPWVVGFAILLAKRGRELPLGESPRS